jgi:drug/metabolite transporter (DMT)-like permease
VVAAFRLLADTRDALYRTPWLLLTLATFLWAANTIAARLSVGEITPMTLTALRWVGVIAVLWPLYGGEVRANWPVIRPKLRQVVAMGTVGFTAFNALFYYAAHETTAVNLGILQGAIPIFVVGVAFVMLGTRLKILQMVGVLTTLLGVIVVATRGDLGAAIRIGFNRGDLAMLIASLLYALYAVGLSTRPKVPGVVFFTLLAVVAAVTALPVLAIEMAVSGAKVPSAQGLLVTTFVAVFPSCLAQLCFLRGVDLIGPERAGVFMNLVPVFAAILGVALLGERFAPYHAVALALVLGGITLTQRNAA